MSGEAIKEIQRRETEVTETSRSGFGFLLTWTAVLLSLYVLSVGPVFKLTGRPPSPVAMRLVRTVYAPLVVLSEKCPPFNNFMEWYCHFWF